MMKIIVLAVLAVYFTFAGALVCAAREVADEAETSVSASIGFEAACAMGASQVEVGIREARQVLASRVLTAAKEAGVKGVDGVSINTIRIGLGEVAEPVNPLWREMTTKEVSDSLRNLINARSFLRIGGRKTSADE